MPLTTITIEQMTADRWNADVEVGGFIAKRRQVRGATFRDVMQAVDAAYCELSGETKPTLREVALRAMHEEEREEAASINRRSEAARKAAAARWGTR